MLINKIIIKKHGPLLLFSGILLLAFVMRAVEMHKYDYWLDEAITVFHGSRSLYYNLTSGFDVQTFLYNILICIWIKIFGNGEIATRSMSLLFGMLSVILIFQVAEKMFNNKNISFMAMLLLAVHPMSIHYSAEARSYSLLYFATLLSVYCMLNYVHKPGRGNALAYYFSSIILLYNHTFGWFVLFIGLIYMYISIKRQQNKKHLNNWLKLVFTIFVSAIPIFLMMYHNFKTVAHGVNWIERPNVHILLNTIFKLVGSDILTILLLVYLVVYILWRFLRKAIRENFSKMNIVLVVLWIIIPLVKVYFFSLFFTSIFVDRYFIICMPAIILLISFIINDWLKNTLLIYSAICIVAFLLLFRINSDKLLGLPYYEPWKKIAADIIKEKGNDDIIILRPTIYKIPFFYYYSKDYFLNTRDIDANGRYNVYSDNNNIGFEELVQIVSDKPVWLIIPWIWIEKDLEKNYDPEQSIFKYLCKTKKMIYNRNYDYKQNVYYFK
jgi:hypothetical protein